MDLFRRNTKKKKLIPDFNVKLLHIKVSSPWENRKLTALLIQILRIYLVACDLSKIGVLKNMILVEFLKEKNTDETVYINHLSVFFDDEDINLKDSTFY